MDACVLKRLCVEHMLKNGYHATERSYTEIVSDEPIGEDGPEAHKGELEYWAMYVDTKKNVVVMIFDNNGCDFEITSLEDLKHILVRKKC